MSGQVPPRVWHLSKQGHWISGSTQPGLGDGGEGERDGSGGGNGGGWLGDGGGGTVGGGGGTLGGGGGGVGGMGGDKGGRSLACTLQPPDGYSLCRAKYHRGCGT